MAREITVIIMEITKIKNKFTKAIVNWKKPWQNELSILYKKAKQKNDVDSYEIAIQMYAEKTKPQEYIPQYTIEEAKAILQELTPWIINWEK